MLSLMFADQFFSTARERYQIKLRKDAGLPRPWTIDRNFLQWRFCQVHREDDRTTVWLREHIREPLLRAGAPNLKILESTLIFRWFNRIETAAIIEDLLVYDWNSKEAATRLRDVSPVVTGAYIIKGMDGYSKLDGVLACIDAAMPQLPAMIKHWSEPTLAMAWADLKTLAYMGGFMSYEVVSDLRWTALLDKSDDIMTWANAGPGCARGLGWITLGDSEHFSCGPRAQREMLQLMQALLALSKDQMYWPQQWQPWEMREVEHWLCEYDKWCRSDAGQSLKRRYK